MTGTGTGNEAGTATPTPTPIGVGRSAGNRRASRPSSSVSDTLNEVEPPSTGTGTGARSQWCWGVGYHGDGKDVALPDLMVEEGKTERLHRWTFHDGYCGIGGGTMGMEYAGGQCVGAFDKCVRARAVYAGHSGRVPGTRWEDLLGGVGADVYYGAPPCEDKLVNNGERQMWQQLALVRKHNYKVILIETVLHFKHMSNGLVYRDFVGELQACGYVVHSKLMFCPDFGSASARRRIMIVGLRRDVHTVTGDFSYPQKAKNAVHHPLSSILEFELFRKGVRVGNDGYEPLKKPKQANAHSLKQVGVMRGLGPGRAVYCPSSFATAQKAVGKGPGWTSGLYLINGTVSRLMVSEVAQLMQFDKEVQMDPVESVARRHLGNTVPVGLMRAMGIAVGRVLKCSDSSNNHTIPVHDSNVRSGVEASTRKNWTGNMIERMTANHEAKMVAWQAASAARAAVAMSQTATASSRWWEVSETVRDQLRRGARFLACRRWLKLQRLKGEEELRRMEEQGLDEPTLLLARATIKRAIQLEWYRGDTEDGPINLIWWNWSGPIPLELIEGVDIDLQAEPTAVFPDNYTTADCDKVWDEIARMNSRTYLKGPYETKDGLHMTHPIGAVAKKGTTKLRIVIDMSITLLNAETRPPRFPLPTVEDAVEKAYPGCWFMTADLVDGFYGVAVKKAHQKYFGIKHPRTGKWYKFARLPMGFRPSPYFFCRLVAWAMREAQKYPEFKVERVVINDQNKLMPRLYGIGEDSGMPVATTTFFVDDSLIIAPTKERCQAAYDRLVWLLEARLGWRICSRKTKGPSQRIAFLGLEMDSVGKDVNGPCTRISAERREECLTLLQEFIKRWVPRRHANRREFATLVGKLSFCANAMPAGRCFLARCYRSIHESDEEDKGHAHHYDRTVPLRTPAILDLRWWQEALEVAPCVRYWKTGSFALHRCWSDASNYGLAESMVANAEGELPEMAFTHGVWPEALAGFSSNYHELATIVHAVKTRGEDIAGSNVHYHTDNTTAAKAVNTGSVRSPQLSALARELKYLQARWDVGIEALHLSGVLIQKQGADGASRSCPWLGMFGGKGSSEDFSPMEWPCFRLRGEIVRDMNRFVTPSTVTMNDPQTWFHTECAGIDTVWHLRPAHVARAMEVMMDAALRDPDHTSFTVVVPRVGMKKWSRYFKHFLYKQIYAMQVEGLGEVHHWVLRFEPGDGRRAKTQGMVEAHEWDVDGGKEEEEEDGGVEEWLKDY